MCPERSGLGFSVACSYGTLVCMMRRLHFHAMPVAYLFQARVTSTPIYAAFITSRFRGRARPVPTRLLPPSCWRAMYARMPRPTSQLLLPPDHGTNGSIGDKLQCEAPVTRMPSSLWHSTLWPLSISHRCLSGSCIRQPATGMVVSFCCLGRTKEWGKLYTV